MTSERIDSDPYASTLRQAKERLHAARMAYEAAGYELDRCSDEAARIERMQRQHQQHVERVLGDPDA